MFRYVKAEQKTNIKSKTQKSKIKEDQIWTQN